MKSEVRVIGIDDGPFERQDEQVLVVGTFFRGGDGCDGVLSTHVTVDGMDATPKLIHMINQSKFKTQTQVILLDGIALGGFNVVNIAALHKQTGIPVVVVVRKKPEIERVKKALQNLNMQQKVRLIEQAGEVKQVGDVFVQFHGMTLEEVHELLDITCTRSYLPEPIRLAHLIAAGIVSGESSGSA